MPSIEMTSNSRLFWKNTNTTIHILSPILNTITKRAKTMIKGIMKTTFTTPKKKVTCSDEAPDGTCPPLAPRKRQIRFRAPDGTCPMAPRKRQIRFHYLGTVVEFPLSEQEENVREEPRRPEKPKKVKLRRSKRIAAHQKNKAKLSPPTRRSTRIAAMNKKKEASS